MKHTPKISRRHFLQTATALSIGFWAGSARSQTDTTFSLDSLAAYQPQGPLRQSVARFIVNQLGLENAMNVCKRIGLCGIDLLDPPEWEPMLANGLLVTMGRVPGHGGAGGRGAFNQVENHDFLFELYSDAIALAASKKVPNLICFSGNRKGLSDEQGLENCVVGFKRIAPVAEKHGITLCMELLNEKDHKDYQASTTPWGAEVCRRVGSERIKLLYDIYHMQRMEGELINNIRKYKDVIAHYHTAGNPGRRDIDETQEIYYPAVVKAIIETGFQGILAHEFTPKNGMESLRRAVEICDVKI